jgi:hypothetical protein
MNQAAETWHDRARNLSSVAWAAVKEASGGETFVDTSTPAGQLSELVLEMATHLGKAGEEIDALRKRLAAAEDAIRPFASIPPVTLSQLDSAPLYAAHYWAVIGRPDKSHFTREDLARARAFLQTHEVGK